jgi:hypothetical protein
MPRFNQPRWLENRRTAFAPGSPTMVALNEWRAPPHCQGVGAARLDLALQPPESRLRRRNL